MLTHDIVNIFVWIHDQKTQVFETKAHSHGIPGSEALETPSSSINCDAFEGPVGVRCFLNGISRKELT